MLILYYKKHNRRYQAETEEICPIRLVFLEDTENPGLPPGFQGCGILIPSYNFYGAIYFDLRGDHFQDAAVLIQG
jgi:hypothetical protein